MSITVERKKRGRPATGVDPLTGVRLPSDVLEALKRCAADEGTSRSDLVREAVVKELRERGYLPKEQAAR